jgi:hypothetical protein
MPKGIFVMGLFRVIIHKALYTKIILVSIGSYARFSFSKRVYKMEAGPQIHLTMLISGIKMTMVI